MTRAIASWWNCDQTELAIEKLRELDTDQQQQVLAFIDSLPKRQTSNSQLSPFGQKLRELRNDIIASSIPLLNDEELDRDAERRGGVEATERNATRFKAAFSRSAEVTSSR
ncbi:hypothetical protein H6F89_31400 [Cyanobacteria bacterium FACHB-63]|nr:hypothetical protein [Cyanobacteria bacterium FACHB-63]